MRSDYLDNLKLSPGDNIMCKCDMNGTLTPGETYTVLAKGKVKDDEGYKIRPSARFYTSNKIK